MIRNHSIDLNLVSQECYTMRLVESKELYSREVSVTFGIFLATAPYYSRNLEATIEINL